MWSTAYCALIRQEFPQLLHRPDWVYLDTAATSLKLRAVSAEMQRCLERDCATVHRALYPLAQRATEALERTRTLVAQLIGAADPREVIFTKGTTESVNLLAQALTPTLQPGDELLVTAQEHHSNLVPWQMVSQRTGATLRILPLLPCGRWDLTALPQVLGPKTRLVACSLVSNVLGVRNPVEVLAQEARRVGAATFCDAAQAVTTHAVDWSTLGVDALAFSAHKAYGPTGVGVLVGRLGWLEHLPPPQGGGDMVLEVGLTSATYAPLPQRWEAGTPAIAEIISWAPALEWLIALGPEMIGAHCRSLVEMVVPRLEALGFVPLGACREARAVVTCTHPHAHPADVASLLGESGVAVRSGHLCAQPLLRHLGCERAVRVSFGAYSSAGCVDTLCAALASSLDFIHQ